MKNGQDVAKALELGAEGVLLASGVTKAEDEGWCMITLCLQIWALEQSGTR